MKIQEIINRFHIENDLNDETVAQLQSSADLRAELVKNSIQNPDREFALALLNKFIAIRKLPSGTMPADNLMLACYNLGLNNCVEDCLKIWEAKTVDFDTYCGLDIQLVVFVGIEKTTTFLKAQKSVEAAEALEYITECATAGDFDDLDRYFNTGKLPYYI